MNATSVPLGSVAHEAVAVVDRGSQVHGRRLPAARHRGRGRALLVLLAPVLAGDRDRDPARLARARAVPPAAASGAAGAVHRQQVPHDAPTAPTHDDPPRVRARPDHGDERAAAGDRRTTVQARRRTTASPASGASCAARASTSCPSCGTCCAASMSLVGPAAADPLRGRALPAALVRPLRGQARA